ncbi:hypothetical protein CJI58_005020 [Bifidobacteriaceae bacterium NR047]|nr:hypothetical protein [Bifidobacteriaceae bacterium NR047]
MADGTQISDTHIVAVAGHGLDPSPVPPEPEGYVPSGSRMSRKNPAKTSILHTLVVMVTTVFRYEM